MNGAITADAAGDAITRTNARLSDQECQDLHRLQVETLIHDNITEGPNSGLPIDSRLETRDSRLPLDSRLETRDRRLPTGHLTAEAIEAIHQQAMELADLQGAPSPELVDHCIAAYLADLQSAPSPPNFQPATCNLQPDPEHPASHPLEPEDLPASAGQPARGPESRPDTLASPSPQDLGATKGSVEKTQLLSLFSSEPLGPDSPDSPDSFPNIQTCQLANVPTPPPQDSGLQTQDSPPTPDSRLEAQDLSWAEFDAKYACIHRGFIFGCPSRFTEVIRDVMNDETLTPARAIEEMRREGRRSQWYSNERIEQCIADYAKLHPRLAGFTIPPLPPPLRGIDRYLRQPQQPPQPALEASARPIAETLNSPELRGP